LGCLRKAGLFIRRRRPVRLIGIKRV